MAQNETISSRNALANGLYNSLSAFSPTAIITKPNLTPIRGRKVYQLIYSANNYTTALINVYSTDFIEVDYEVHGRKGNPVFTSSLAALSFIKQGIVLGFWDKALGIPTKEGTGLAHV